MPHDPLKFKVAPHIVQDLGLNLYTSLPRVLVEFVANAYDADSPHAHISLDKSSIDKARTIVQAEWKHESEQAVDPGTVKRLAERTLPDDVTIVVEDAGHGMSREDLQNKFLVAGRRRRVVDGTIAHSPNGRVLMGRKGLGKLAGFGVAQLVEVISRAKDAPQATRIVLDYEKLISVTSTNEIPVQEVQIDDDSVLPNGGTRIILSRLLYEPMKSRLETIEHQIGDHFAQIEPSDFEIKLNDTMVEPAPKTHVYAWPEPERPANELAEDEIETEDGYKYSFQYRLRFVEDRKALAAKDRGVRIYAHKRLAAAPSLLDADTNMHGFRMTDYLDGVVYADFIDDQQEDYIATDRQALRWDSPFLSPLYDLLSREIKAACYNRQQRRDEEKDDEANRDEYTQELIKKAELNKRETKVAQRVASAISSLHKKGFEDDGYKTQITQVIKGMGEGEILSALSALAKQEKPDLDRVVAEITRLTAEELDGFYRYVRGRLDGIEALRRIVNEVDFRASNNEDTLHDLLNKCPWLIDPTYFEFLTSERSEQTMFKQLERVLKIGSSVPDGYDKYTDDERSPGRQNKRPDLVFILGNQALNKLVIVELKAPNTPLHGEHYRQLQNYLSDAKKWLNQRHRHDVQVEGMLIGSLGDIDSRADEVQWLQDRINETHNQGEIRVFSIDMMLERTESAHKGLLEARGAAEKMAAEGSNGLADDASDSNADSEQTADAACDGST